MKHCLLLGFLLGTATVFSQLSGTWQGMLVPSGKTYAEGIIFFLDIGADGAIRTREEISGKEAFAVRKGRAETGASEISFTQGAIEKKKDASGVRWCGISAKLRYSDSTGYLQGDYASTECRGNAGRIILYRSDRKITAEPSSRGLQAWKPVFADDLSHGRKAPEI